MKHKLFGVVVNIVLVIAAIGSIVVGFAVKNLNCWFDQLCTINEAGYWPYFWWFVIPVPIVTILALFNFRPINRKK